MVIMVLPEMQYVPALFAVLNIKERLETRLEGLTQNETSESPFLFKQLYDNSQIFREQCSCFHDTGYGTDGRRMIEVMLVQAIEVSLQLCTIFFRGLEQT